MRTLYILILASLCLIPKNFLYAQGKPVLVQTIRGVVKDNASQTPLPGVTVAVVTTNPLQGTTTDSQGNFRIEGVPVGRHTIKISFIGYEDHVISEMLVGTGKEVILTVGLSESLVQMQEVVISASEQDKGQPINEMALLSARSVSVDETKRYAASVNDPARAALSYAGVSSTDDGSNNIVIRGNSPRGLLWRLEGVEVPNPNHFGDEGASGGGISILSVNMLDNSDFFTGAFPAEYGNALSGVFDIKLRKGNNEKREYAAQAGLLGLDFAAEGPFSRKSKASYLANYRYSTLGILDMIGVKIGGDAVPNFQDFAYKVHVPTAKAGVFSVWGIGGLSRQIQKAEKDSLKWSENADRFQESFSSRMMAHGISHFMPLGQKTYLESVLTYSLNGSQFRYDSLTSDYTPDTHYREQYTNQAGRLSVQLNHKFNAHHTVRTGFIYSNLHFDLFSEGRDEDFNNQLVRYVENNGNTYFMQAYAQWKYRISEKLTLNTGLHSLYFGLNGQTSLEPRAGIKWQFAPRQAVGAGFGVHSRIEAMSAYFAEQRQPDGSYVQPNRKLGFSKAQHYIVSYENQLFDDLRFKGEVYYQRLYNVPVNPSLSSSYSTINFEGGFTTDSLVNTGKGQNYGLELTLEKFFTKNYYFLLNTSLYNSLYTATDGKERNTRFNGKFINSATAGKEFKVGKGRNNLIGINVRLLWAGGRRYTPIDLEKSREQGKAFYLDNRRFELQAPNYFRTDVRVSYRKNRPKASYILSLDIQNVTNRLNVYSQYYDQDKGDLATAYQVGLIPVLNYRIEF